MNPNGDRHKQMEVQGVIKIMVKKDPAGRDKEEGGWWLDPNVDRHKQKGSPKSHKNRGSKSAPPPRGWTQAGGWAREKGPCWCRPSGRRGVCAGTPHRAAPGSGGRASLPFGSERCTYQWWAGSNAPDQTQRSKGNPPAFLSNFLKHCLEPIFLADFWDAIVGAPWDLRMEHVDV